MFRIPVVRNPKKVAVQHRTAVVGAAEGCGVSFVAGLLAADTARKAEASEGKGASNCFCTLAELSRPYFYTALSIDQRFPEGGFCFFEDHLAARKSFLTIKNCMDGLSLLLRRPDSTGSVPAICACKMPGEHVVFDLSGASGDLLDEVLPEMDDIVLVLDPLPSRLIAGSERFERLRMLYPDLKLVVNKMNRGVHRAELRRFLGGMSALEIPLIDPSLFYRAEYSCVLPAQLPEVQKLMKGVSF